MKFDAKGIIILILSAVLFTMMLPVLSYVIQDNFVAEECEVCEDNSAWSFDEDIIHIAFYDTEKGTDPFEYYLNFNREDIPVMTTEVDLFAFIYDNTGWTTTTIEYTNASRKTVFSQAYGEDFMYMDNIYITSSSGLINAFNNMEDILFLYIFCQVT